jgi:hypothetical protein
VFKAGVARRVVTPDPLLPVTRGPGDGRQPEQLLMDLEVRALVLEQGETRIALLSMPFLGWTSPLCNRVRSRIREVPETHILISATHTHAAPDVYGLPGGDGERLIDIAYLDWVCMQAADAVADAVQHLQPVSLKTATGPANGQIAYNLYAPQLYDPRCSALQFIDEDGATVATLVNYAIHPEILLNQPVCSPDLIGPLCRRVEEALGGTALFINGAQGGMVTADIRSPEGDREDWSECVRIGTTLANEAVRLLSTASLQENPPLACSWHIVQFPVKKPMEQLFQMADPAVRQELTDEGRIAVPQHLLRVGDAWMLTVPGEALPNIGFYLKRQMGVPHALILGLTNEALGYMMSRADYESFAVYEYITATSISEDAGEILMDESLGLMRQAGCGIPESAIDCAAPV